MTAAVCREHFSGDDALKLYLVRHSETPCLVEGRFQGQSDRPGFNDLSDEGRHTAERVAGLLDNADIRRIFCSPLRRTRETAQIIGRERGLEPIADDRLIEVNYGDWEGRLNEDVYNTPEAKERERDKFNFRHPNGESYADLHKRVSVFLDDLTRDDGESPVLIVGHAGTIRSALIYFGIWSIGEAMETKPAHEVVYEYDTRTRHFAEHKIQ